MLKNIKNLIMQKQEFLESASAIFEDGSGMNLDDVIVLSEDAEVPEEEQEESEGDFSEDEIEAPEDDTNNIDNESSIEDSELNNIPDDNNEEPSLEDEPLNDNMEIPNDSNNEDNHYIHKKISFLKEGDIIVHIDHSRGTCIVEEHKKDISCKDNRFDKLTEDLFHY